MLILLIAYKHQFANNTHVRLSVKNVVSDDFSTAKKLLQYSLKVMHVQELLFASTSQQLLAASYGKDLGSCKMPELLCGYRC